MSIETNLNSRIEELELALRDIRDNCAYNLAEPGNEDDTFDGVISRVNRLLRDNYTFDLEKYLND